MSTAGILGSLAAFTEGRQDENASKHELSPIEDARRALNIDNSEIINSLPVQRHPNLLFTMGGLQLTLSDYKQLVSDMRSQIVRRFELKRCGQAIEAWRNFNVWHKRIGREEDNASSVAANTTSVRQKLSIEKLDRIVGGHQDKSVANDGSSPFRLTPRAYDLLVSPNTLSTKSSNMLSPSSKVIVSHGTNPLSAGRGRPILSNTIHTNSAMLLSDADKSIATAEEAIIQSSQSREVMRSNFDKFNDIISEDPSFPKLLFSENNSSPNSFKTTMIDSADLTPRARHIRSEKIARARLIAEERRKEFEEKARLKHEHDEALLRRIRIRKEIASTSRRIAHERTQELIAITSVVTDANSLLKEYNFKNVDFRSSESKNIDYRSSSVSSDENSPTVNIVTSSQFSPAFHRRRRWKDEVNESKRKIDNEHIISSRVLRVRKEEMKTNRLRARRRKENIVANKKKKQDIPNSTFSLASVLSSSLDGNNAKSAVSSAPSILDVVNVANSSPMKKTPVPRLSAVALSSKVKRIDINDKFEKIESVKHLTPRKINSTPRLIPVTIEDNIIPSPRKPSVPRLSAKARGSSLGSIVSKGESASVHDRVSSELNSSEKFRPSNEKTNIAVPIPNQNITLSGDANLSNDVRSNSKSKSKMIKQQKSLEKEVNKSHFGIISKNSNSTNQTTVQKNLNSEDIMSEGHISPYSRFDITKSNSSSKGGSISKYANSKPIIAANKEEKEQIKVRNKPKTLDKVFVDEGPDKKSAKFVQSRLISKPKSPSRPIPSEIVNKNSSGTSHIPKLNVPPSNNEGTVNSTVSISSPSPKLVDNLPIIPILAISSVRTFSDEISSAISEKNRMSEPGGGRFNYNEFMKRRKSKKHEVYTSANESVSETEVNSDDIVELSLADLTLLAKILTSAPAGVNIVLNIIKALLVCGNINLCERFTTNLVTASRNHGNLLDFLSHVIAICQHPTSTSTFVFFSAINNFGGDHIKYVFGNVPELALKYVRDGKVLNLNDGFSDLLSLAKSIIGKLSTSANISKPLVSLMKIIVDNSSNFGYTSMDAVSFICSCYGHCLRYPSLNSLLIVSTLNVDDQSVLIVLRELGNILIRIANQKLYSNDDNISNEAIQCLNPVVLNGFKLMNRFVNEVIATCEPEEIENISDLTVSESDTNLSNAIRSTGKVVQQWCIANRDSNASNSLSTFYMNFSLFPIV